LDLVVEGQVIVEIKAVSELLPVHEAALLSYLKQAGGGRGLLINFKPNLRPIKLPSEMCLFPSFQRLIFAYFNQVCQKITFKTQKKITNSSGACIGRKLGFNVKLLKYGIRRLIV
jgi:PD-(D/E)XK nuclease superfamily